MRWLSILLPLAACSCLLQPMQPLTGEVASDGSVHLRKDYAAALASRDEDALRRLYASGTIPTVAGELLAAFPSIDRAQIWFHELEKLSKTAQRVVCWVEVTGGDAEERRSGRGTWQWHLEKVADSRWRIRRHELIDWRETSAAEPSFYDRAEELGLAMMHEAGFADPDLTIPETHSGGGVALADYDADGHLDVYVASGGANRLFRNRGDGTFDDVTDEARVGYPGVTRGLAFVDLTGDGLPDLYLANAHQANVLYRNRGDGTFEDFTQRSGTGARQLTTSVAIADVDLDGDLDIFLTVYRKPETDWPNLDADNGERNLLYLNDGGGRFAEAGKSWGLVETAWSLAASFADYDGDGDPDLYVANDFGVDHLYRNDGESFEQVAPDVGIRDRGFSMSVAWGDADGDGDLDLYVSKMTSGTSWMFGDPRFPMRGVQRLLRPWVVDALVEITAGNTLYENLGDGSFRDISREAGVAMAHWAWGSIFFDADNDGDLDIYCANGFWSGESADDT